MTEKSIKEQIIGLFKDGALSVFKVVSKLIIEFMQENPFIVVGLVVGLLFGSWISGFIDWIPLIGSLFSFMITLVSGVIGGILAYKIKKGSLSVK